DEHRSQFEMPEQRQVAQILVASEADAKTMYTQLITGADFAELAQHKSRDAQSASSGGDLGWINATNVPAAFNEVLTLAKGNFTKPIHSENGWHIIKVLDTKPKSQRPFDEVKDEARRKALDIKQKNAQLFWVQKLRAAAEIQVDDGAVKEFVRLEK
ncbi:MAG TPA: peptidylprolyl isomerase, partial [Thermoanaerobaculia bacterium]|nr:peptidylprolyl isomerase [Thermoanaerobaculia bacterium]